MRPVVSNRDQLNNVDPAIAKALDEITSSIIQAWGVDHDANTDQHKAIRALSLYSRYDVTQGSNTGLVTADQGFYEHGRQIKLGEWQDIGYNPGNFTADVGTWTVQTGDQITLRFSIVGLTCTINIDIRTSSVSAAASQLNIALPPSIRVAKSARNLCFVINNGTQGVGQIVALNNTSTLSIFNVPTATTWAIAADTTYVLGQIALEIFPQT